MRRTPLVILLCLAPASGQHDPEVLGGLYDADWRVRRKAYLKLREQVPERLSALLAALAGKGSACKPQRLTGAGMHYSRGLGGVGGRFAPRGRLAKLLRDYEPARDLRYAVPVDPRPMQIPLFRAPGEDRFDRLAWGTQELILRLLGRAPKRRVAEVGAALEAALANPEFRDYTPVQDQVVMSLAALGPRARPYLRRLLRLPGPGRAALAILQRRGAVSHDDLWRVYSDGDAERADWLLHQVPLSYIQAELSRSRLLRDRFLRGEGGLRSEGLLMGLGAGLPKLLAPGLASPDPLVRRRGALALLGLRSQGAAHFSIALDQLDDADPKVRAWILDSLGSPKASARQAAVLRQRMLDLIRGGRLDPAPLRYLALRACSRLPGRPDAAQLEVVLGWVERPDLFVVAGALRCLNAWQETRRVPLARLRKLMAHPESFIEGLVIDALPQLGPAALPMVETALQARAFLGMGKTYDRRRVLEACERFTPAQAKGARVWLEHRHPWLRLAALRALKAELAQARHLPVLERLRGEGAEIRQLVRRLVVQAAGAGSPLRAKIIVEPRRSWSWEIAILSSGFTAAECRRVLAETLRRGFDLDPVQLREFGARLCSTPQGLQDALGLISARSARHLRLGVHLLSSQQKLPRGSLSKIRELLARRDELDGHSLQDALGLAGRVLPATEKSIETLLSLAPPAPLP